MLSDKCEYPLHIGITEAGGLITGSIKSSIGMGYLLMRGIGDITKPITLSIIGCVVNGPGEAAQTEIGLTGGGNDSNLLYLSGIPHKKVINNDIIQQVVKLVEKKVEDSKSPQ